MMRERYPKRQQTTFNSNNKKAKENDKVAFYKIKTKNERVSKRELDQKKSISRTDHSTLKQTRECAKERCLIGNQ